MGRNRGQGQQDKKKGEVKIVRGKSKYNELRRKANLKRNLLREANKTQRKLERLMKRSRDGKPGGIMPASERSERLYDHIRNLKARAKNY